MKIKDFQKVDRPREKLKKYGTSKLSDKELLAILLSSGIKGKNVIELSKEILNEIKKVGIENINNESFKNIKGLGDTKTNQIISFIELGRRLLKNKKAELIMSPKDVWEKMEDLRDSKKEYFVIFFLDSRNQIIKREIISVGTLNSSLVHPREVFEPAIRYSTSQIIISHNHPSGLLKPSEEDLSMTKRLLEAGKILGIDVLDHIIVCKDEYKSLREGNLI
jgi:DNA repair protein RadC